MERKSTVKIRAGNIFIGGDAPVSVQSMTCTDTRDVLSTVLQIGALEEAGCDLVRVAVPDMEAAAAIREIKKRIRIPLAADIHFDYRLALASIVNGADKIRINPGNIGGREGLAKVATAARERGVPIRIGVNSGSLEKRIIEKYGGISAEGMAESAVFFIRTLEDMDFCNIVVSIKASGVPLMIDANRIISGETRYPLHLGVTEAGTSFAGTIKSCAGIGALLSEGIGDTIRVSLTADPADEVRTGIELLRALGIRKGGIDIISCPTCGRCGIDLVNIAEEAGRRLAGVKKDLRVAVMGCAVNGPGEAAEADIGIAGGIREALLFKKGKAVRKINQDKIVDVLIDEIMKM